MPQLTFTFERFIVLGHAPFFLFESRTTTVAFGAASVVFAIAHKDFRIFAIGDVARLGVAVAHASATDTYVFYRVEVLKMTT